MMPRISSPDACRDRMAVSRPAPGPFTNPSTLRTPCSWARRLAASAASWAANGVDFRDPLKPTFPADAHDRALPAPSVIVTIVLLKVDLMWACPWTMFFFSLRLGFFAFGIRLLLPLLTLHAHGLLGALAGPCVGVGPPSVPAHDLALLAHPLDARIHLHRAWSFCQSLNGTGRLSGPGSGRRATTPPAPGPRAAPGCSSCASCRRCGRGPCGRRGSRRGTSRWEGSR